MDKAGYLKGQMTPWERRRAIEKGEPYDHIPCMPFMGELKCALTGISYRDFWYDPEKMAETELAAYRRFGYDRIVIGPNTRGIVETLGGTVVYPDKGIPYTDIPYLSDYRLLDQMEAVDVSKSRRLEPFYELADRLQKTVGSEVPIEASVGGPFTIASQLRGVEQLLRDCRKQPGEVQRLLRIVTNAQKSCIDAAAKYGLGIAMADPVANPSLIGPKMYEKFVFPYTLELTKYAKSKTGFSVSLHMCGSTYAIWKYLRQYDLHELSLDNIVDLNRAVEELGDDIPLAGNVDPVSVVMNGTEQEIRDAVSACMETGMRAKKGFTLATGCDIPEITELSKVDIFMDAVCKCN